MSKNRLEAFSDGVMAILITIMVLELRSPAGTDIGALRGTLPELGLYALSFAFIGIYWNNHHHLLQAVQRVSGAVLWANSHLLFWLSLVPFTTRWMWETAAAALPTAAYGVVLLMAAVAYWILVQTLLACHPQGSLLAAAVGSDFKGKASIVAYLVAVPLTYIDKWIAVAIFALVALMWLAPDRRIESKLKDVPAEAGTQQ